MHLSTNFQLKISTKQQFINFIYLFGIFHVHFIGHTYF